MDAANVYFEGLLTSGTTTAAVSVRYASRYSLWLRFDGRKPRGTRNEYSKLALQVDGRSIEMGPCRIFKDEGANEDEFRLVPLRSIHDFEKLFFRFRVDTLESGAVNLPLIISYKRSIDSRFSSFVADLTYDLSAYKTLFDQIDVDISDEPPHVLELLQRGIIDSLGQELLRYLDEQHERLKAITADFTDDQHEHHGFYFRKQLWNIILCAPIMARTNLKPRGYIGDSEMMRLIYENDYSGDSTFGKIMHKHPVSQPAAQAVRNRRYDLARILREFVAAKGSDRDGSDREQKFKVLSVACGPAMELTEVLQTAQECRKLHFSLLDQDRDALLEAAGVVEALEQRLGAEVSTDFIRESVRTMLVTRELQKRWGRFDFIYSMGLFDYLTKPVATAVLKKLFHLLLPGGEMIIGNFAFENPSMQYMAYWMDWTIVYRSEEEMFALASELEGACSAVYRDETGIQIFLSIKKRIDDE